MNMVVLLGAEPNPVDFGMLVKITAAGLAPNTWYIFAFVGGAAGNPVQNNNVSVKTDGLGMVAWDFQIRSNVASGTYICGVFTILPLGVPGDMLGQVAVNVHGTAVPPPPPNPPPPNGPPLPPPPPGILPNIPIEYLIIGAGLVLVVVAAVVMGSKKKR